jgi:NTP pyrophosphatase (non-canonical NTP hydrolase)
MSEQEIFDDIKKELKRAKDLRAKNNYGKFNSAHEAFAILYEEVDEFWEEVRKKKAVRSKANMKEELIQIIGVAIRTIEDLEL